jgi:ankyrin repeat protein
MSIYYLSMRIVLSLLLSVYLATLTACSEPQPPTINLYRAVNIGDIDQIQRNLYWHADVNQPGPDGATPLHVAARKGSLVIVKMLVEQGADLEARDKQSQTPLSNALFTRNTQVAAYLISQGASLEPDTLLQKTVGMGAADRDVIDFLVKQGAQLERRDQAGNAPLHLAILNGHRVTAKYLVQKGADIDALDKAGRTPLQLAIELGEQDIARMLRVYGATTGSP